LEMSQASDRFGDCPEALARDLTGVYNAIHSREVGLRRLLGEKEEEG
jgi:hypothetical protein